MTDTDDKNNPVDVVVKTASRAKKKVEEVAKSAMGETKDNTTLEQFIEHQRAALTEAAKALESLVPTAFREHGQTAVKEMVEGYRTLVNSTIDNVMDAVEKMKLDGRKDKD